MTDKAIVYYPNNELQALLNVKDSINVNYSSPWPSTNLTMLCRGNTATIYDFYNMPNNPISAIGTYLTPDIGSMKIKIDQYPADCFFRLTQFGIQANLQDSVHFKLTSNADAQPRTFAQSSTIGASTSTPTSISTTTSSVPATITSATATGTATSTAQSTASAVSSPDTSRSDSTTRMIIVSTVFAVLAIIASVIFLVLFRRRQRRKQVAFNAGINYEKAELQGNDAPLAHSYYGSGSRSKGSPVEAATVEILEKEGSAVSKTKPVYEMGRQSVHGPGRSGNERHELA